MHYDTDWTYRLRATFTCDEAFQSDPCFATHACMCSNGYFAVSRDMVNMPEEYDGYDLIAKRYIKTKGKIRAAEQAELERLESLKITEEGEPKCKEMGFDDWRNMHCYETWHLIVGVFILFFALLGLSCMFY